jgi:HK97 family phage prohead protease
LQLREPQEGEAESRTVEGTPIVFGVRSVNLTPYRDDREVYEVLEPGCITNDLLQRSDVILNLNHSNMVPDVLGRCRNGKGTLSLELRENKVECRCDLPHTNNANDALELMRRGDITGMSFAFEDDWQDSETGVSYERTGENRNGKEVWIRHVKRITGLYDVAIVTHPAYEQTSVGTREQSDRINEAIDAQLKRESASANQETDEERKAREERELEEQAEMARMMLTQRLRSQRRHLEENFK